MTDPLPELQNLDRYFAAGTLAHEYAADLHRELAALDHADGRSLALIHESATIILERMPELVGSIRDLAEQLSAQQLLEPSAAEATRHRLGAAFAEIEPALRRLRARQDEIAASLRERLNRARQG